MKKSIYKIFLGLAFWLASACAGLWAQTNVNMAATGVTVGSPFSIAPPADCFFNFYDNGGATGSYNFGANAEVTFLPANPATHRIQVSFTSFSLETDWDALFIFNSNTVGVNQVVGPQGATFSGFPAGNWQNINPGTITANTGIAAVGANASEALTFQFRSDNSVNRPGWSAIVRQVPKSPCVLTAPDPISTSSVAGVFNCFVNVTTPLPTVSPAGCSTSMGLQLQYRINGGAATVVTTPLNTVIAAPIGSNVVTWELVDPCGGGVVSSATQLITVADQTPPVVNCPGNATITLNGGDCKATFNYSVSCTDNCASTVSGTVAHPIDFDNGQAGIMFNLQNLSPNPLTITQFGPSLDAGNWMMEVYYTTSATTWLGNEANASAWTLAGRQNVMSTGPAAGTPIPGFGIVIPAGQSRGIYLTSANGVPLNYTDVVRQFDDGRLRVSSSPGAGKMYPFGATFYDRSYNGFVTYSTPIGNAPVLLSGLPSGSQFPQGTTTNVFRCIDGAGNSSTCSFTVTVLPHPNPDLSLTCNDLSFLALDEDCNDVISADQILLGDHYKCYDHYVVQIDKIPPFGNGPWVAPVLGSADIGKTYKVRVTDPDTDNKCTGDIKIVDNIAPMLDCSTVAVALPCNYSTDPLFSETTMLRLRFGAQNLPLNVVDLQTRELNIPLNMPPGAVVNDVDFRTKISGDAFFNNLRIQVVSPAGTVVTVWNQQGGCAPAPLFARFDDEGSALNTCATYSTDQNAQIPAGGGTLSSFDNEGVNGTWKIRIADLDGGGDVSKIEIAELYIKMSGTFGAGFPNGLTAPPITQIGTQSYNVPIGLLDGCSKVTLTYTDQSQNQNCPSPYSSIINRRWVATDASGNSSTCIQQIQLLRPTLDDLMFPPDYDGVDESSVSCADGATPTPQWLVSQGLQGWPLVFGLAEGCGITWTYVDTRAQVCDGTYNLHRFWTATDFCTGQIAQHSQLIRVEDRTGPAFLDCPDDLTVTTDPFACCGTFNLPDALVADACSRTNNVRAVIYSLSPFEDDTIAILPFNGNLSTFPGNLPNNPDTLAAFGTTSCIPIGRHIVTYVAEDACGNSSTCSFLLTVADYSPPVPVCDEYTVVSLGVDDPTDCYFPSADGCEGAGVAWVRAESFDNGSHDNCNALKFTVRRAPPYSACIQGLSQTPCQPGEPSEYTLATIESDSVKFYCCEVGTEQKVILRAYQLNPDGSIATFPDGEPIFNECEVEIEVQDKLRPHCDPPLNITVSCENFDPSLWAYGRPNVYDNCCLDPTREYQGQKGLTHSANYAQFDSVCNRGTIIRNFRAYDCHGFSTPCTQKIVVNYEQDFFVKFPDDALVTVCDGTGMFGQPQFFGEDCELLAVSYSDQIFTVVSDACYKVERTWKIINWCTYIPQAGCIEVPNPTPNSNLNHFSNMPGPIVSAPGTPAPWAPTVSKILPTDANTTNFSNYWNPNVNCYEYKQIVKVIDNQPPIAACPPGPLMICDSTANDQALWNESYWWESALQSHDLCEAPTDLQMSATDFCSGSNVSVRYLLFLDLDGDGTMETTISSTNPPAPGTVNYNNVNSPNYTGGTVRNFDKRNVAANQKYRFALQTTVNGTSLQAAVRWNTVANPGTYTVPELPYGKHKIKWISSDGCGNETVCEYLFEVKDCKAPSVFCNGFNVTLMQTGMVTLFASDFILDAFDNCTPEEQLLFGIRKAGTGEGFPFSPEGEPIISLSFDCGELGPQAIELWVIDASGNADYCETTVLVQDNLGNCNHGMATVAGMLRTESGYGLEESDVELSGQTPGGPQFNHFGMSDQEGHYDFSTTVPINAGYTVTPTKDDNPLNGVTTYDLVLISKHILGTDPLDSPYKMIAADANSSGSITSFDIVELRKLILGIHEDLPNNTSWRFVDKAFDFPTPTNPFQSGFPESKIVSSLQGNAMEDDFVAIKIGDVNGSAIASALMASGDRTEGGTLLFDLEDRKVKAGDVFEVNFKAASAVEGYQFTLNHPDLDLADIIPGAGMKAEHFAAFSDEHALTTSWNGEGQAEFMLKFRAKRAGDLSKMLSVSSRITKAEAYAKAEIGEQAERLAVALRFQHRDGSTVAGVGFELYQNQPNPFLSRTVVGFHLPESTEATLSVFDPSGRMVFRQSGKFEKGYNTFIIEKSMLNTSGVLTYTLETETDSASKKMVQAK
jgi:hypothetical protein